MAKLCPVCQHSNDDTAKFCSSCGSLFKEKIDSYDGFISYRREGGSETARVIKWGVEKQGNKKIFLDVDELRTGRFDEKLLEIIEKSENFILILTPGSLDRCSNEEDWLYRELSYAFKCKKNIIPIVKDGFTFPDMNSLPPDIRSLINLNYVYYNHVQIDATFRQVLSFMISKLKAAASEVAAYVESATVQKPSETKLASKVNKKYISMLERKMVPIQGGEFMMGSENSVKTESPLHKVILSDFYIMKYMVTQREYEAIMGTNPSNFAGNPDHPVESVSWFDAARFCNKLSELSGLEKVYEIEDDFVFIDYDSDGYRLPTEAEWEYACRANTTTVYFWSDDEKESDKYAWYDVNSEDSTHTVGTKLPNPWGLYDMLGNAWEWCNDWFIGDYYSKGQLKDPTGLEFGEYRVLRGGSWFNGPNRLRSACRLRRLPHLCDDVTGFRCVRRKK